MGITHFFLNAILWVSLFLSASVHASSVKNFRTDLMCPENFHEQSNFHYDAQAAKVLAEFARDVYVIKSEQTLAQSKLALEKLMNGRYANALVLNSQDLQGDMQAFVWENDDKIIVSVKGTDELIDWEFNLTNYRVPLSVENKSVPGVQVHMGFNFYADRLIELLQATQQGQQILNRILLSEKDVFLTGHSLGGAVVTLLAAKFREMGVSKGRLQVYTFGAPAVGDDAFVSRYEPYFATGFNIFRVRNQDDVVPYVTYLDIDKLTISRCAATSFKPGHPAANFVRCLAGKTAMSVFKHRFEQIGFLRAHSSAVANYGQQLDARQSTVLRPTDWNVLNMLTSDRVFEVFAEHSSVLYASHVAQNHQLSTAPACNIDGSVQRAQQAYVPTVFHFGLTRLKNSEVKLSAPVTLQAESATYGSMRIKLGLPPLKGLFVTTTKTVDLTGAGIVIEVKDKATGKKFYRRDFTVSAATSDEPLLPEFLPDNLPQSFYTERTGQQDFVLQITAFNTKHLFDNGSDTFHWQQDIHLEADDVDYLWQYQPTRLRFQDSSKTDWDSSQHMLSLQQGEKFSVCLSNSPRQLTQVTNIQLVVDVVGAGRRITFQAPSYDDATGCMEFTASETGRFKLIRVDAEVFRDDLNQSVYTTLDYFYRGYVSVTGSFQQGVGKLLFRDDFNGAERGPNPEHWIASGYDVVVSNGHLGMYANVTDNTGRVKSKISIPSGKIKVTIKHYMSPGGSYFFPKLSLGLKNGTYLGAMFMKSDYFADNCGDYGNANKISIYTSESHCNFYYAVNSSDFYNKWVETTLIFDPATGLIQLDLGNDKSIDFEVTLSPEYRADVDHIYMDGYGWWTFHQHLIDWITVEAGSEYDSSIPTTTFLSENLPDGTYQLGAATKRWRFKTADVAVAGLKAVRVSADAALGIQTAEIPLGDVAANSEFLVELPLQVSRGNQAVARSVWKLVDGTGKDVQISNSKTNTFWLSLRTNRPPQFAALQKTALGGEVGNLLQLPLQATDADGDALTFSVVSGGGSIIDKVSRVSNKAWQGSFAQAGVQPLQLAVSDGLEQDLINIDAVIYTGSGLANFFTDVQYPGTDDINSVYSAVHFLAGKGIVMGASTQAGERYFEPARAATQAEALKMLLLAAQERGFVQLQQAPYIPEHYQNQISQNGQLFDYSWAADYAYTAEQLGMVDNLQLFEPAALLSREQAAYWLEQLLELESPLAVLKARGLTDRYQFSDATAFAQPAHYQAALKTALFGYLGTLGQNFRPADPINRGDFAVIAARVLRTATVVGLTSQQVQLAERFGQQMPVVKHGQTLQINGVTGLAVSEISQQGQLIKEEWLDPAQSYVRIGITLDDGTALGTARMIDQLASKPLLLNTNNLQLTRSSMINLIVLLENTRSGVISAQYLPLALDFADKDGDGRRDDVDAFPEDNRYSRDANKNGVPDEVEDLLRELGIDGTAKATVNGVAQSYSLAYAIAFGLAYDKTTTGLPQDKTAPVIQLPPVLTIQTPHSDGLPATNWQLANYLAAVKAVDNLDLHVKLSHDAPARFAIGQTLLTFTATDQAGNISKATATVTLELVAAKPRKSRMMKIILLSQPQSP